MILRENTQKAALDEQELSTLSPLMTRLEEATSYHDTDRQGFFSILCGSRYSKKQKSYKLAEMPDVLADLDPTKDTWMSQAEFYKPSRRLVFLKHLCIAHLDLDSYRTAWGQTRDTQRQVDDILAICRMDGIPEPSIIVYSGNGLQLKWFFESVIPSKAVLRWNALQRHLVERLKEFGADPAAKDASRVLRLVETVNSKTGNLCKVVHVTEENGQPIRYSFEYLCACLLPKSREEIQDAQKRAIEARERRQAFRIVQGHHTGNLKAFNGRELAWARMSDLQKLKDLRGDVEGMRMLFLFWQLNFLLLSGAAYSRNLYYEASALARSIDPSWTHYSPELVTLYRKAKEFEAGQRIEFQGKLYPALYTPRNDTLINTFKITDDEQRQLQTIISKDMAAERTRERDRLRDLEKRREAGAVERAVYEAQARQKAEQAKQLRNAGWKASAIAEKLDISIRAVYGYLK